MLETITAVWIGATLLYFLFVILMLAAFIYTLIDIARHKRGKSLVLWIIFIVLFSLITMIVYWIMKWSD